MVDAQNVTNIQDKIINAVETIIDKKMTDDSRDKTIKATVVSCKNPLTGEYNIQYGTSLFTAFGDKAYENKSQVYILIPENDYNKKLFIIGSADTSNTINNTTILNNSSVQVDNTLNKQINTKGYHILDSSLINTNDTIFSITENSYNYIYKYDESAAIDINNNYTTKTEEENSEVIDTDDDSESSWVVPTIDEWNSLTGNEKQNLIDYYNDDEYKSLDDEALKNFKINNIDNIINNSSIDIDTKIDNLDDLMESDSLYKENCSILFGLIIKATIENEIKNLRKDDSEEDDNDENLSSYSNVYNAINESFINISNIYSLSKATSLYIQADFKDSSTISDGVAGIVVLLDYKQGNNIITIPYYLNMNSSNNFYTSTTDGEYVTYDTIIKITESINFVRINSIIYYSENYTAPMIKIKNIKIYPLSSIDDNDEYTINLSAENGSLLDPVSKTNTIISAKAYYNDIDITNKCIFYWGIESCEENIQYNNIIGANYSYLGSGSSQVITINDVNSKCARVICISTYNDLIVGKEYLNIYNSNFSHMVSLQSIVDGENITLNCMIDGRIYNDIDSDDNEQDEQDESRDSESYEVYSTKIIASNNITGSNLEQNNYLPFIFVSGINNTNEDNLGDRTYYFIGDILDSTNSDCESYGSSYNDYWKYTFRPVVYKPGTKKDKNYLDKNGYILDTKTVVEGDIEKFGSKEYNTYAFIGPKAVEKNDWSLGLETFFEKYFYPLRIQVIGSHYQFDVNKQDEDENEDDISNESNNEDDDSTSGSN